MAIPAYINLLNSGSKDMNVNGSIIPKTYSYSPGAGNSSQVKGLTCIVKDEGTTTFDKFGALTALSNGVLIQATVSGVTTTITTLKDNGDLATRFNQNQFGNGAVVSVLGIITAQGWGGSNNIFAGYLEFSDLRPLVLSDSDTITITIQDNLTNIDFFQVCSRLELL